MHAMVEPAPRRSWRAVGIAVLGLVIVVLTVTNPPPAVACSCVQPPPPQAALEQADAVFAGTVVTIQRTGQLSATLIAEIEVDEVWTGEVFETVTVTTAGDSATCGVDFTTGARWLVYAELDDGSGLSTHLCTRTARATQATADFDALEDGSDPLPGATARPPTAEVSGGGTPGRTWILVVVLLFGVAGGVLVMRRSGSWHVSA
jgi:hypothetical protein